MDYKKDINKGLIRDINKRQQSVSNDSSVFFESLIQKAQKITSALYLVTDFISNNDPIKVKIREKGLAVLSGISSYYYGGVSSDKSGAFLNILNSIAETTSLIEVSMMGGLVSEMNASIMKKEYLSLRSLIESRKSELVKDVVFNNNFFKDTTLSLSNNADVHKSRPFNDISLNSGLETKGPISPKVIKTGLINKPKENIDLAKGKRKDMILDLLRNSKGELSVRDIAMHIKGYSEKTLQRDLISMVNEGLIGKKGERRWSRYSFIFNQAV